MIDGIGQIPFAAIAGDNLEYIKISNLVKEMDLPYGQEYVSLIARQGTINRDNEGRIWFTTKDAMEDYIKNKSQKES